MWDMDSGVKATEKHDFGNDKILGSSGGPLFTLYRPKILMGMYSGVKANQNHDYENEKM